MCCFIFLPLLFRSLQTILPFLPAPSAYFLSAGEQTAPLLEPASLPFFIRTTGFSGFQNKWLFLLPPLLGRPPACLFSLPWRCGEEGWLPHSPACVVQQSEHLWLSWKPAAGGFCFPPVVLTWALGLSSGSDNQAKSRDLASVDVCPTVRTAASPPFVIVSGDVLMCRMKKGHFLLACVRFFVLLLLKNQTRSFSFL